MSLVFKSLLRLTGLSELNLEDKSSDTTPAAITSSILQQQSQQLKNLLMRSQVI